MCCVELAEPVPDEKVVKDALATVIQHQATPTCWFNHAGYASGPAVFDLWAQAFETGGAIRDGHSYNAAFGEIAADCTVVCERLQTALVLNPFHLETWDGETKLKSTETVNLLHQVDATEWQELED